MIRKFSLLLGLVLAAALVTAPSAFATTAPTTTVTISPSGTYTAVSSNNVTITTDESTMVCSSTADGTISNAGDGFIETLRYTTCVAFGFIPCQVTVQSGLPATITVTWAGTPNDGTFSVDGTVLVHVSCFSGTINCTSNFQGVRGSITSADPATLTITDQNLQLITAGCAPYTLNAVYDFTVEGQTSGTITD